MMPARPATRTALYRGPASVQTHTGGLLWECVLVVSIMHSCVHRSLPTPTKLPAPIRTATRSCSLGDVCSSESSCCAHGELHGYSHSTPQSYCLLDSASHLAVDWVGRVEAFEQDFAELLDQLNARPGVPSLPLLPPPERANVAAEASCYEPASDGSAGVVASSSSSSSNIGVSGGAAGDIRRFNASTWKLLLNVEGSSLPSPWLSQLTVEYPCDRRAFYSGSHGACLADIAAFYAVDVRLLHGSAL